MWRSNGCRFAGLRVKRAPNRRRWVAVHVPHTARKLGPGLRGVASGWLLSRLRCSACALFSYVLSAILAKERFLQFQLRRDNTAVPLPRCFRARQTNDIIPPVSFFP